MAICDKDFVFRAALKIQIRYIGLLWGSCMEKRLANCSRIWNLNQKIKVFSNPLFLAKIWMVFEWGGAYHSPLGTDCWCLIIMSNNIYICLSEWDLNSVRDIKVYVNWMGWGIHLGTQSQCHWMHLIILNNNICLIYVSEWSLRY